MCASFLANEMRGAVEYVHVQCFSCQVITCVTNLYSTAYFASFRFFHCFLYLELFVGTNLVLDFTA